MFTLPELPYAYDALAPYITEDIMKVHHQKHHAGYTKNLNTAIEGTEYEEKSIEWILQNLENLDNEIKTTVRNNGGGYYNHTLFWENMAPGGKKISDSFKLVLTQNFGGMNIFQESFGNAAGKRFGSGWAWLVKESNGDLSIVTTPNQDTPLSRGQIPILGLDVWEHAYYLQYKNRRGEYIKNFWNVVNRSVVEKRYKA